MEKYRVVLVDDHEVFRMGLKLLLSMIDKVEVVGEAENGLGFLDILRSREVDLAFMDINMPVLDGIDTTERALQLKPGLKVVALTTFGDVDYFNKMIYAGVEGFMMKNSTFSDFQNAIDKVMNGGNFFSAELLAHFTRDMVTRKFKEKSEIPEFSKREIEVLQLICKGYSNAKIGEELFISDRTVERHKTNLISKTNTANTINLILYAVKHKLVEI